MTIQKTLIAVDDIIFGAAITDFVTHHDWGANPEFLVLHVVQPLRPMPPLFVEQDLEQEKALAQELVMRVSADIHVALRQPCSMNTKVELGVPKEKILEIAKDWQAKLIVLGSHGRQGFDHFIMGSVSMAVMSHARCSVAVIRLEEKPSSIEQRF